MISGLTPCAPLLLLIRVQYTNVLDCMRRVGFVEDTVQQVLTVLAAILHIGNIVSFSPYSTVFAGQK